MSEANKIKKKKDAITRLNNSQTGAMIVNDYLKYKARKEYFSFFLIEILNLKPLNDKYGYIYGDALLMEVADIINSIESDKNISIRISGLEFAILIKDCEDINASAIARTIIKSIEKIYTGENESIHLSAKVAYHFTNESTDFVDLINKLDYIFDYLHENDDIPYISYSVLKGKNYIAKYNFPLKDRSGYELERAYLAGDLDIYRFAFKLLERAEDLQSALNVLIARIGRNLNFDSIIIFGIGISQLRNRIMYSWSLNNDFFDTKNFEEYLTDNAVSRFFSLIGPQEYITTEKITEDIIPLKKALYLDEEPSACYTPLYENGKVNSIAVFIKYESNYKWKKNTLKSLVKISEVIAINISKIQHENANQDKTWFLAKMGNELDKPVSTIIGFSELIMKEAINPRVAKYAENIKNYSEALLGIINELSDVTKIEAGNFNITNTIYEVSNLFKEVYSVTMAALSKKNIQFYVDLGENIPVRLSGDYAHIKQILINLLSNAIKFTPEGSVIFKIYSEIIDRNNVMLYFSITDTGIGIKDSDLNIIFNDFEKLDYHTTYTSNGSGLGLTIAKQLAKMMGGDINVKSKFNVGSTFVFNVPQYIVQGNFWDGKLDGEVIPNIINGNSDEFMLLDTSCLLVSSDEDVIFDFMKFIKSYKMNVDVVSDTYMTIKKLNDNRYDIIFVCDNLDNIDANETAKLIRTLKGRYFKTVPIIKMVYNLKGLELKRGNYGKYFSGFLGLKMNESKIVSVLRKHLPAYKLVYKELNLYDKVKAPIDLKIKGLDLMVASRNVDNKFDDLIKALSIYIKYSKLYYLRLSRYFKEKDYDHLYFYITSLKSASSLIGALKLSKMCENFEEAYSNSNFELIDESSAELINYYITIVIRIGNAIKKYSNYPFVLEVLNYLTKNMDTDNVQEQEHNFLRMSITSSKAIFLNIIKVINRFEQDKAIRILKFIYTNLTDDEKLAITDCIHCLETYEFKEAIMIIRELLKENNV
ncbi:diguanylate cyclase (GGDEF) domain-containing protein [Acetitomaculum ruminis DSM 5522]|uniref:Circadian input-output histidine kinase CikA n=1 Tax=Acetitomaculum ruminis DSM 5522 TaxID=1120918 RepID=A0A1I0V7G2_9FIRM|nr:ATP-binding protein [Acetitomaculum ruminis]SFA71987.1 diguanylate cyclase (GGDEF) domain-containing protein [Acetitomaculum ruminis DSM 5522]